MRKVISSIVLGFLMMNCSNTSADNLAEVTTQLNSDFQQKETIIKDVDAKEFKQLVGKKEGQILDVRTPKEWSKGVIEGAIKMNYYDKDFKEQLTKLDKTQPVYVYCKAGGRSSGAAKQMKKMGFTSIYNLKGGIGAWNDADYATVME